MCSTTGHRGGRRCTGKGRPHARLTTGDGAEAGRVLAVRRNGPRGQACAAPVRPRHGGGMKIAIMGRPRGWPGAARCWRSAGTAVTPGARPRGWSAAPGPGRARAMDASDRGLRNRSGRRVRGRDAARRPGAEDWCVGSRQRASSPPRKAWTRTWSWQRMPPLDFANPCLLRAAPSACWTGDGARFGLQLRGRRRGPSARGRYGAAKAGLTLTGGPGPQFRAQGLRTVASSPALKTS